MTRTGVFATPEQAKQIVELAETARTTPCFALSSDHALNHGGFSGDAWSRVHQALNAAALANGLPEITGEYGFDGENREFLTV